MSSAVCSVCGMGGYWVAYDPTTDSVRCVNHIGSTPESLRYAQGVADRGMCMVCGTECTTREHDAQKSDDPS